MEGLVHDQVVGKDHYQVEGRVHDQLVGIL